MKKTPVLEAMPLVDELEAKAEKARQEINTLSEGITKGQREIAEFQQTLKVLIEFPTSLAEPGTPLEALQHIIQSEEEDLHRQKRIQQCSQAIAINQSCLQARQRQLEEKQAQLRSLLDEIEWQRDYLPQAYRYVSAYEPPLSDRQRRIREVEEQLVTSRQQLEKARTWLQGDVFSKQPYYSPSRRHPQNDFDFYRSQIPQLEAKLAEIKSQPEPPADENHYREYIRGRVDLEPQLAGFLKIQDQYLEALRQLQNSSEGKEFLFHQFRPHQIIPQRVIVRNQKIVLEG